MKIASPRGVLALLLAVNILNYVDRYVLSALLPLISGDLHLTDAQGGLLAFAFMIVYMLAAPPIAWLADTRGRRPWIAGGVALWSVATGAAALATGFASLFASRAAVGVGEACYGAISPSFVAERFPPEKRGRALALFSMAIPVGAALGYAGGGLAGKVFGWRHAFLIVGLPGLILAALCGLLPGDAPHSRTPTAAAGYSEVFAIPCFRFITLAMAAMTFALGGLAAWMPTFFYRNFHLSVARAGMLVGAITVLGGLVGSLLGGWLSDRLRGRWSDADLIVSGAGLIAGMPLAAAAIITNSLPISIGALFLAEALLFLNMGPLTSAIVSVTRLETRSMAFAANILVIHLLGDAASPALIGWASDHFGLSRALLAACPALGLGGALCFLARAHFNTDAAHAAGATA